MVYTCGIAPAKHFTSGQKLISYKHLALNKNNYKPKVRQRFANTVHFAFAMENTTNPWSQMFTNPNKMENFPAEPKPYMCKLWHLCSGLCDTPSLACWPNNKQIF